MAINKALIVSDKSIKGDEVYTPFYAVEPLLEYIPKDKTIWCPFDKEWSAFVQIFKENGNKVLFSHIDDGGKDFFYYEPDEEYDIIISNPPYSKKDKILEKCCELNKPFALLLPVPTIQGKKRVELFNKYQDIQLLCFDTRVSYHRENDFIKTTDNPHFGSLYICRNFLPKQLIFKELIKYNRPLKV